MNKIICAVCGTSYPDTATQCPICGYVRPAEAAVTEERDESGGYTYVKGGRFSKSNVRKRNQATATPTRQQGSSGAANNNQTTENKAPNKRIISLVIVLVLLLLIVGAMIAFIFLYPGNNNGDVGSNSGNNNGQKPGSSDVQNNNGDSDTNHDGSGTTDQNAIACTGLDLSEVSITLTRINEIYNLTAQVYPKGCTQKVVFGENSEGKIITVDQNGKIECVGIGNAIVTVTCGEYVKECRVTVEIPEVPNVRFFYSEDNILKMTHENEQYSFYASGDVTADKIKWISENPKVATVDEEGVIHAVADGETLVHAIFETKDGDVPLETCKVICEFKDFEVDNTQEGGIDLSEYQFGSVYGALSPEGVDTYGTSLKVGDKIQFGLIHKTDRSKNIYFEWVRTNPDDADQSVVASEDKKTIERVSAPNVAGSYCVFKATYNGKDYYLKVRYFE